MAMVGVALVLYGLIKLVSWTFTSSGSKMLQPQTRKLTFIITVGIIHLFIFGLHNGSTLSHNLNKKYDKRLN